MYKFCFSCNLFGPRACLIISYQSLSAYHQQYFSLGINGPPASHPTPAHVLCILSLRVSAILSKATIIFFLLSACFHGRTSPSRKGPTLDEKKRRNNCPTPSVILINIWYGLDFHGCTQSFRVAGVTEIIQR